MARRRRKNQTGPEARLPIIGFGLYDGHGLSSAVSDRCQSQLLSSIAEELQVVQVDARTNGGDGAQTEEGDSSRQSLCIRRAFAKFQRSIRQEYSDKRVGSTATVVLLAPAIPATPREELTRLRGSDARGEGVRSSNPESGSTQGLEQDLPPSVFMPSGGDDRSLVPVAAATTAAVGDNSSEEEEELAACWRLTCAWVGDSRAIVILPDGLVRALSIDHRLDVEEERQRVTDVCAACNAESQLGGRRTVVARRQCTKTGQMGPEVIFNETTGKACCHAPSLPLP